MRPLYLTMSAFLSYGEKQEIDFTKLGSNGLYLITGETGAGKTTIFDAIMFALYGEASGDLRDGKMFRSKYADLEAETYVELRFECNGKEYRVRRKPEYERAKKRGDGVTKSPADAVLESYDGRPLITKVEAVTAEIEKIIGLTRDQFSQIAMIAQGQFRELLVAETKERREIFRHLFQTGNYDLLQQRIAEESKALKDEAENTRRAIQQDIASISMNEEDGTVFAFDVSADADLLEEKILQPLKDLIQKDENLQEQLDAEKARKSEEKDAAVANVEKARKLANAAESLSAKQQEQAQNNTKLTAAKLELDEAKMAEGRIDELKKQQAVETSRLPDYDKLEGLRKDCSQAEKDQQAGKIRQKHAVDRAAEIDKNIAAFEQELITLADAGQKKVLQETLLSDITQRLRQCTDLNSRLTQLDKKCAAFEKAVHKAAVTKSAADVAADKAKKYRDAYFKEQAGMLALGLEEGMKCPVCGSLHHPELAVLSSKAVSREAMDAAEAASRTAADDANAALTQLEVLRKDKDAYAEETLLKGKELLPAGSIEELKAGIAELFAELMGKKLETENSIHQLNQLVLRKEELDRQLPDLRERKDKAADFLTELAAKLSAGEEKLKSFSLQITDLQKTLPFAGKAEAEAHIAQLNKEARALQARIDAAQKNVENLRTALDRLAGEIAQLQETIASSEPLDLAAQQQLLTQLQEQLIMLESRKQALYAKITQNRSAAANIAGRKDALSKTLKKYIWLKSLDDTMSGKSLDGNGKIMLETYVQQAYFDRIVAKANIRFERMSQGHYTMERVKELAGAKQGGLDLEVVDHYNASRRSVKSLSGGEQFEASLSLALGLSDMVQEMSAGVKLDCMFIDEGFGSLDEETLNRALVALKDLSDGNRLVGIISHVNELQKEIDKKILVKKDARGFSRAEVNS